MHNLNSVREIVSAIEEYYSGEKIEVICSEHQIRREVFDNWLAEYKQIAIEFMALRMENERLRKIFVDLSLKKSFSGAT